MLSVDRTHAIPDGESDFVSVARERAAEGSEHHLNDKFRFLSRYPSLGQKYPDSSWILRPLEIRHESKGAKTVT